MVLVETTSAQRAAHADHKSEGKAYPEPRPQGPSGPRAQAARGAFRKKVRGMECRVTLMREKEGNIISMWHQQQAGCQDMGRAAKRPTLRPPETPATNKPSTQIGPLPLWDAGVAC